jgi:hypothetical protein
MLKVMLAVVLFAAQIFGAAHQSDLAAHASDQVCHVCVSLGSVDASNVAADIVVLFPAAAHGAPERSARPRLSCPLTHGFGVSVRTLQEWEQGRRAPSGAARTLLMIAAKNPRALLDVA